jgi:hypothetical protein
MTLALVGEMTIQAALPFPALAGVLVDLQLRLSAMIDFSVKLGLPGLSIAAQLQLAAQITAALQASLAIGITPPSLNIQLGIVLSAIALLEAQIALFGVLLAAGVFVYVYDGPTNGLGAALTTELATGFPGHAAGTHANVIILGTVDAATWTAMQVVFNTHA